MTTIAAFRSIEKAHRTDERVDHPLIVRLRAARGHLLPFEAAELHAALATSGPDVELVMTREGAELYAKDEEAIGRALARISGARWQHLIAESVDARTRHDPLRHPWMEVTVRCERRFVSPIRRELESRGGRADVTRFGPYYVVLVASAPLSGVLGFADWVLRTTGGTGHAQSSLAEWRVVEQDPDPPFRPAA